MDFRTRIHIDESGTLPAITHADTLLLLGSCFAEHMGNRLQTAKFSCAVNPFGVLYNPASILTALRCLFSERTFTENDLFQHGTLYHSFQHHSSFSTSTAEETLARIYASLSAARSLLPRLNRLLLTFGSAFVYTLPETGDIVANCHKLPERTFIRRRLTISEIVDAYDGFLRPLLNDRPEMQVILTVSPIRHLRDGLIENQRSKALLLLAIEQLCQRFPQRVFYFPAYEILMDDLRDYRFYDRDMLHPSPVATDYVWKCFGEACFSEPTRALIRQCEHIIKGLSHIPFRPEAAEYRQFLQQLRQQMERLQEEHPILDFHKEIELCHTRLNS
ncbi:MAG: GSCFA domain-containing protein [Prevotellaceae bacterium]|jgi:hypothetical protein|nr:GSCFA domain-containing protein [Prevotellaceae bacterium]